MEPKIDLTAQNEVNLANFSARAVAFSADLALAATGYFLSLKLCFPAYSPLLNPYSGPWISLWTAVFLLYQAYSSCQGRRSLGKALIGLRIIDLQGQPLSFGKAATRSAVYLASSVFNLGFLWSLFTSYQQGWHDLAVGSIVIADKPQTPLRQNFLRAMACACMAIIGGLWYWNNILAARYTNLTNIAYAQTALEELKQLQTLYFYSHGRFADNMPDLARQSATPNLFMKNMSLLFDRETGVKITTTPTSYKIVARATDDDKTLIAYNGP